MLFEFQGIVVSGIRARNVHDFRTASPPDVLSTRAWTLQERLIPRRLLTYSSCVFMECREGALCECGSGVFPDPFCGPVRNFNQFNRRSYTKILEISEDPVQAYNYWISEIVIPYIHRDITKDSDRLTALSALAAKFSLLLEDMYIAGIWRADIWRGLCWSCINSCGRPSKSFAPSWSWASIEGGTHDRWNDALEFPRLPNLRCQVLDCQSIHKGRNTTGEVSSGTIRIKTPAILCSLKLIQTETNSEPQYWLSRPGYASTQIISPFRSSGSTKFDCKIRELNIKEFSTFCRDDANSSVESNVPVVGSVYCALIFQDWCSPVTTNLFRAYLILGIHPEREGAMQRIGYFSIKQEGQRLPAWFGNMNEMVFTIY